ncbi:MAG: hypothetical protein JO361_00095 [Gammaproteobacteria bacterium]|nr:hypothetical protein [Gammaproteobacteria bacterium]
MRELNAASGRRVQEAAALSVAVAVGALATFHAGIACAAAAAGGGSDTRFANYAFASELGSGIYEISGRTVQVYQFLPSYHLRRATPRGARPGIKLISPITVGFFNFQSGDLLRLHLPNSIGALSLEPGVEFDWWVNEAWDVYPYFKVGGTFSSSTQLNAVVFGTGVRSDYHFDALGGTGLYRADLAHAGVHYQGDLPNDSFTRLRNAIELRHNLRWVRRDRQLQVAPYAITDVYFDAPSGPASGISANTVQFEAGVMLGVIPEYQVRHMTLPRIGVGYRAAGLLSGWRLVIGDPF